MNNNYSAQRFNDNIHRRLFLGRKNDSDSSSSDSDFSDSCDSRLDDDFNAMLKRAQMKTKVKEEQLSVMVPNESFRVESNAQLNDCVPVIKPEEGYEQQEITEIAQQNENNVTVIEKKIRPESATGNVACDNVNENDQIMNDETVSGKPSQFYACGIATEPSVVGYNDDVVVEEGEDFSNSLTSDDGENSVLNKTASILHSTARQSTMPEQFEFDESWTDCDSEMTETNSTVNIEN